MSIDYSGSNIFDEPSSAKKITGSIYLYKNDPKIVNKGVNISNFRHTQGGNLRQFSFISNSKIYIFFKIKVFYHN